ncbi:hypothetical protein JTE90_008351 [Oedothorax gibbosus]|uniref:Uncharacterized protein n=1 Tax=Oedothorax gibbosus TaxID=931172 RepID=A0AAV6TD51_9ARAC|nr:hypothetical protein JTE90_008351 [Oedothorax gibbosus]
MGTDRHENYTISLGFSRANRGAPDTARDAVLYENSVPISGRADSRDTNSYKEKITLPRSSVDVSEFGCVTALGPEGPISVSGLGNINPIPFRSAARQTRACLQSSRLSLEYLLLPPRSAPVAAPGGLTPGTFNARHRDPPTHCGVNLHEGSSAVAARYRPNAGASSIFRASCFGR